MVSELGVTQFTKSNAASVRSVITASHPKPHFSARAGQRAGHAVKRVECYGRQLNHIAEI